MANSTTDFKGLSYDSPAEPLARVRVGAESGSFGPYVAYSFLSLTLVGNISIPPKSEGAKRS